MASSLAFWLEEKEGASQGDLKINTEVHINYWSLTKDNINFLDIGIKLTFNEVSSLEFSKHIDAIKVYLPFEIETIEYNSELGQFVCTDQELLSAIFNSYIQEYSHVNDSGIHNITLPDGKELSFFTQIEELNGDGLSGVTLSALVDKKENGTLISFPAELFSPCSNVIKNSIYFRFRIKLLNKSAIKRISTITKPKWSMLLGDLNVIETVDFRINEARNLPYKIRGKVNKNKSLNVVHFFLIREAISEFKASHSNYERCRVLEKDIWNKYLGLKNNKSQYLIYHWKEKTSGVSGSNEAKFIDHFSAFAKFTSSNVTKRLLGIVIFSSLVIGIIGGLGANYFWKMIDNSPSQVIVLDEHANIKLECEDISGILK